MKLSDRIRPDVEAAPWVIEEVKKLEQELARRGVPSYGRFQNLLKAHTFYETLYEDSEGRDILVIQPVDLYRFVCRFLEGDFYRLEEKNDGGDA